MRSSRRLEHLGTDYHKRYGYKHEASAIVVHENGKYLQEAVLLWMTATETTEDLAHFLNIMWPQIDAAVIARRSQNTA